METVSATLGASNFVHIVGTCSNQLNHLQLGGCSQFSWANFYFVNDQDFCIFDAIFQSIRGGERVFSPGVRAPGARQGSTYGFAFQPNDIHGQGLQLSC